MMDKEAKIEEIKQRARKNFSLGYNCAECVTEAVLSLVDTGLPQEVKKWRQALEVAWDFSVTHVGQLPALSSPSEPFMEEARFPRARGKKR